MKLTQLDFHMTLKKFLIFLHMSKQQTKKGLKLSIRPKKIEYADILAKFELLYKGCITSGMKSENRNFPKNKLKDICFSTLKSYSFDKVKRKLLEAESITLRNLIERKDLLFKRHTKATQ